jgi:hypothetical protein
MKSYFSNFKNRLGVKPSTLAHRNPYKDWFIMLIFFAVMFLVILGIAGYMFLGINNGTLMNPNISKTPDTPDLDKASITSIADFYITNENKLESLKSTPMDIIDPGL